MACRTTHRYICATRNWHCQVFDEHIPPHQELLVFYCFLHVIPFSYLHFFCLLRLPWSRAIAPPGNPSLSYTVSLYPCNEPNSINIHTYKFWPPHSYINPLGSDSHVSRWGRRRPFIVLGAILTAIGLFGFGFVTGMDSESVALSLAVRQHFE